MNRFFHASVLLGLLTAYANPSSATLVFYDDFNDGDVSNWTITTNYSGTAAVKVQDDFVISSNYSLITYLEAPPGGNGLFVRASVDFDAPITANYSLDLWARSAICSGCTISYDVLIDGDLLDRKFAPDSFESRTFDLIGLSAGTHSLSLGMYTNIASSGQFSASFDDVKISTTAVVPIPATFWLLGSSLFGLRFFSRRS